MKDNRFIDLVNLYIDRQITAAETAELEAEIQSNPRHRAIYRQYCRMHRATMLLYESFRAGAPEQRAAASNSAATISRLARQRRLHWGYYAIGITTAACLALVFVQLNLRKPAEPDLPTIVKSQPMVVQATVTPTPQVDAGTPQNAAEPRPGLVSLRNNTMLVQDYLALLNALRQEELQAFEAAQARPDRLPSLFDDGVFDSQQYPSMNNPRVFQSRRSPVQQSESRFTAFQFQR